MKMCGKLLIVFNFCFISLSKGSLFKCDFDVKLTQSLENEGFHRNLTFKLAFNDDNNKTLFYKDCVIGVNQWFPPGVFANPDELDDLNRNQMIHAISWDKINIELPAEQSERSSVLLLSKIVEDKAYLWVPVHGRYHKAVSGGGMARNEIGPPRLLLRCPDYRIDRCDREIPLIRLQCAANSRDQCHYIELPFTSLTDTLIWEVPVGNTDHYYIVAIITSMVIIGGSLYLLKCIHEAHQAASDRKKIKK